MEHNTRIVSIEYIFDLRKKIVEQKILFGFWNKMLELFLWSIIAGEQTIAFVPWNKTSNLKTNSCYNSIIFVPMEQIFYLEQIMD